jgi:hypothetical protein
MKKDCNKKILSPRLWHSLRL